MDAPGLNGFLPFRASLAVDLVAVAMLVVLPIMGWSIFQVKYRRRFAWHRGVQLTLAILLLSAVILFEVDMRVNGWEARAEPSPYYPGMVKTSLYIHLPFSISTSVLWVVVIVAALKRFPNPPVPGAHSRFHKWCGRLAAAGLVLTAITGWIFYYLAFVA